MEYFVTGGTGLIGSHVARQLVDAGHDVVILTRDLNNAAHLPDAVTVAEGDLTEPDSMQEHMDGVDGVFHIAAWFYLGADPSVKETAERINVNGTRNVLELMESLEIKKGVYTSTVGVFPGTSGAVLDESLTPECPTYSSYHQTKWQAHYEIARPMAQQGLPLITVLPSAVYGPGDKESGSLRGIFEDYLRGNLRFLPRGLALSFDHVADIATAHIRAMERGRPGEEYIIASEAQLVSEVFEIAESITGIPKPRTVPDVLISGMARLTQVLERMTTVPRGFESEVLSFAAGRQFWVDPTKARRDLGIEHRPLEEGLREYLAWEASELDLAIDFDEQFRTTHIP